MIQECPAQKLLHFQAHDLKCLGIDRIGFGQHGNATPHAQQLQNVEVLPRLRLDRLIRRNHQQHQINATHACQHVAHKALVPGNIDKAQPQSLSARRLVIRGGQVHVREAKVNGDASPLLFLQSVSINPGQSLHQRGFTVVDVPSRSYNDGFHLAGILPENAKPLEKVKVPNKW